MQRDPVEAPADLPRSHHYPSHLTWFELLARARCFSSHPYLRDGRNWGQTPLRQKPAQSEPRTYLAERIRETQESAGLTLRELTRALSEELGSKLGITTVFYWATDKDPARFTTMEIEAALRRIRARYHAPLDYPGAWVSREEVQRAFQQWINAFGRKAVVEWAGIDRQSLSEYVRGRRAMRSWRFAEIEERIQDRATITD